MSPAESTPTRPTARGARATFAGAGLFAARLRAGMVPAARLRAATVLAIVVLAVTVLASCSSGAASTSPTAAATPAAPSAGPGGAGNRAPGVSGLVAAVSGTTMQVQSQTKQTAVTWTDTTSITKAVAGSAADVVAGSCVVVRSAGGDGDSTVATSVQVTMPAADGSCAVARFAGGGTTPSGMPRDGAPSAAPAQGAGAPTDRPTGSGADSRGGFGAIGKVVAVGAASFTVQRTAAPAPGDPAAPSGAASGPVTAATVTTTTVTTTDSTAYTKLVTGSGADVKVGLCATAQGPASETGALTATSVVLRDPAGGTCVGTGQATAGRPADG